MDNFTSYVNKKTSAINLTARKISDSKMPEDKIKNHKTLIEFTWQLLNKAISDALDTPATYKTDTIEAINEIYSINSEVNGNISHISINGLLPLADHYKTNKGRAYDLILGKPIRNSLDSLPFYNEKVVIVFIFTVGPDSNVIDLDNFNLKPIIDSLKTKILINDSGKYVSLYMDEILGDVDSTDIYIVPETKFADFAHPIDQLGQFHR